MASKTAITFPDIFVFTFNTVTIKKIICVCSKIAVKSLHKLTEITLIYILKQ